MEEVLEGVLERGFEVRGEGDKLFIEPWKRLDPADFSAIRASKSALLELLALERWKTCQKCKADYDSTLAADIIAICDRQPCHLRKLKK